MIVEAVLALSGRGQVPAAVLTHLGLFPNWLRAVRACCVRLRADIWCDNRLDAAACATKYAALRATPGALSLAAVVHRYEYPDRNPDSERYHAEQKV